MYGQCQKSRRSMLAASVLRKVPQLRRLLCTVLVAISGLCFSREASAQSAWEYSPYQIRLWLVCNSDALSAGRQNDLATALVERARTVHGSAWEMQVADRPPALRSKLRTELEELSADDIATQTGASLDADKLLLVSIEPSSGWFVVRARELDCRTQQWSAVAEQRAPTQGSVPLAAWEAMQRVFTPLARIESVDGRKVMARVRAGGLVTDSNSSLLIRPEDILRPIVRRNDRSGEPIPGGIQAPDWTLLRVTSVLRSQLYCQLVSGYRAPIPAKGGQRTERLALLIKPVYQQTRLVLMSRTKPSRPLGGYDVFEFENANAQPKLIGATSQDGSLVLTATDRRLKTLIVRSGQQLLARLPLVPGQAPELVANIVDDDGRLQAEGFVLALQSQVMDLVARRELLSAVFRQHLAAGRLDEAQDVLEEFRLLETRADLSRVLDQQQQQITSRDRTTQIRIQKLFADARKLLLEFLDPETANELARELALARSRTPPTTPASAPAGP